MALNLGAIRASLNLNAAQFTTQLRNVSNSMRQAFGPQAQNNINNTANATRNLTSHLKSVERIVGGIVISQGFYRMLNQLQNANSAMFTFMNNMQKAQIAMEYFLGSAKEASAFMYNMKDFAASTAFSTEQALNLSRRLMAAQFDPTKVRSMMEILNDASAASGGTAEQMDRIVLALTQMRTNGKIAGQELRQFAEAGIPIYQILKEELGLTSKELMNIGRMKISGDLGVQAVLTGLEKRYKGAAERIANTVPGMLETIKDDMLMIGEGVFAYPYQVLENGLRKVRDALEEARDVVFKGGFGELFEKTFDKGTQQDIRMISGALRSLGQSLTLVGQSLLPVVSSAFSLLGTTLSFILAPIAAVARVLAVVVAVIMQVAPWIIHLAAAIAGLGVAVVAAKALMILWRVLGVGLIANAVALAVSRLTLAIRILMMTLLRNPIILAVMAIAGGLVYLASKTKIAHNALAGFNKLTSGMGGYDPSSIFKPVPNEAASSVGKYGEAATNAGDDLAGMTDAAIEAGKATDKAGDKAKKAAKKIKDSFASSFDELYQVPEKTDDAASALDDLGKGLGAGMPDIESPEIGAVDDAGFGMGDLGGGLSLPSVDPTSLFDSVKNAIQKVKDWFSMDFVDGIKAGFNKAVDWVTTNGPRIAAAVWGFVKDSGLAIHNWLMQFDLYKRTFESLKAFWEKWGDEIKSFFSNVWDLIKTIWDTGVKIVTEVAKLIFNELKAFWAKWGDDIIGFFTNSWELIKTVFSIAAGLIWDTVTTIFDNLKAFWDRWGPLIVGILKNVWENVKTVFIAALDIILDTIGTVFALMNDVVKTATAILKGDWESAWNSVKDFLKTTWDWIITTLTTLTTAVVDLFKPWIEDVKRIISDMWTAVSNKTSEIWNSMIKSITGWIADKKKKFEDFKLTTIAVFKALWESVRDTVISMWTVIVDKIKGFVDGVSTKFNTFKTDATELFSSIWTAIRTTAESKWASFTTFITGVTTGISGVFSTMKTAVVGVFEGMWSSIKTIIDNMISKVNDLIEAVNSIELSIPEFDIPGIGTVGGGSIGMPNIPKIPGFARGGIIDKHQLIQAGEGNKREVVVPLENPTYMRPFSQAVANDLAGMFGGMQQQSSGADERQILYVGTLIADDRGLKELERKMRVVRLQEDARGGR